MSTKAALVFSLSSLWCGSVAEYLGFTNGASYGVSPLFSGSRFDFIGLGSNEPRRQDNSNRFVPTPPPSRVPSPNADVDTRLFVDTIDDDILDAIDSFTYNTSVEENLWPNRPPNVRTLFTFGELFGQNLVQFFQPRWFYDQGGTPFCGLAAIHYAIHAHVPQYEDLVTFERSLPVGVHVGSVEAMSLYISQISNQGVTLCIFHNNSGVWSLTPINTGYSNYDLFTRSVVIRFRSSAELGETALDSVHGHWDVCYTYLPPFLTDGVGGCYMIRRMHVDDVAWVPISSDMASALDFPGLGLGRCKKHTRNLDPEAVPLPIPPPKTRSWLSFLGVVGYRLVKYWLFIELGCFCWNVAVLTPETKPYVDWITNATYHLLFRGSLYGFGLSLRDMPSYQEAYGFTVEECSLVFRRSNPLVRLFGKAFSSDITGDGPGFRNRKVDHQKPVNGGRADENDQRERPAGQPRKKHPAQVRAERREEAAQEEKSPPELIVFHDPRIPFGWDGKQVYDVVGDIAVGQIDGSTVRAVPLGVKVEFVYQSAIGYAIISKDCENPKTVYGINAFVCLESPAIFEFDGVIYPTESYHIFVPFLEYLRKKVSTPILKESHRNVAMAAANRLYPCFEQPDVLVSTYSFYHLECVYKLYRLTTGTGHLLKQVRDRQIDCEMLQYGELEHDGDVVVHESIDCPLENTYQFRQDCVIRMSEGVNLDYIDHGCVDPANPISYPLFEVSEDEANSHRYYRSIYTGFYPEGVSPFVMYSVNAKNACLALKRMCASRENHKVEHVLSTLQYTAFCQVFCAAGLNWAGNALDHRFDGLREKFLKVARLSISSRSEDDSVNLYDRLGLARSVGRDYCYSDMRRMFRVCAGDPKLFREHRAYAATAHEQSVANVVVYSDLLRYDNPSPATWLAAKLPHVYEPWTKNGSSKATFCPFRSLDHFEGDCNFDFQDLNFVEVYDQMRDGFADLLASCSRSTLTDYANSHPKWIYRQNFENFTTFLDYAESRQELAAIKHVKKALRTYFVNSQVVHSPDDNMTRIVEAKVKKEFAKQGKVPRLYVTYDAGCMYANELPEYVKICLDGCRTYERGGMKFHINIFAKPTTPGLAQALKDVIGSMSSHEEVYILIYSDDSVWAGNMNGVDFGFNVDISSCDSGNKGGVFGLIFMLLSQFSPELAVGLVSQCANRIKLTNPEEKDHYLEIYMHSLFEGSGTVLTTILNHVAMFMIAQAAVVIFSNFRSSVGSWERISDLVVMSGRVFGHVLTVEPAKCEHGFIPEKIQFLKRSPIQTVDGFYIPCLNYGTIFRSFGSVEGDLTADMVGMSVSEFAPLSVEDRANVFLSGVVAGLKNEPNSIVLSALRRRFDRLPGSFAAGGWESLDQNKFSLISSDDLGSDSDLLAGSDLSSASLCRRYDIDESTLNALAGKISSCRIRHLYPDSAVGAFSHVDYGCSHL